jgi:hypothetical protein
MMLPIMTVNLLVVVMLIFLSPFATQGALSGIHFLCIGLVESSSMREQHRKEENHIVFRFNCK